MIRTDKTLTKYYKYREISGKKVGGQGMIKNIKMEWRNHEKTGGGNMEPWEQDKNK